MNSKKKEYIKEASLIIISFLLGGLVMYLVIISIPNFNQKNTIVYEKNSINSAIEKVYDSVFYVQGYYNDNKNSSGTAFAYKTDNNYGYLLTNEHVIGTNNKVIVTNSKDLEVEATILGKDEYLDLAVLRVEKKYVIKTATFGNSEKEKIGNTVFTVGSPLGYNYRGSVSSGILSGKNRHVTTSTTSSTTNDVMMQVLQVDASINPGNSGGPLLNIKGEVIGICTLKLVKEDIEGMGFAIPIEYAKAHIDSLEKGEEIKWPKLGINMANVNDTAALLRNDIPINIDVEEGVVVTSTEKSMNLKKGDIIIKVNNNKVKDIPTLRYEIYKYKSGDTIQLTFIRNNQEKKANVTLS